MNNNIPPITKNLLIINVLCFFGAIVAERYGIDAEKILSLHFFMASDFNMGQLVTYMFMHGGFTHIFFNMFALWMFGRVLEQVWGPKRFLIYYMVCGIGAGLIQEIQCTDRFRYNSYGRIPQYDAYRRCLRSNLWYPACVRYALSKQSDVRVPTSFSYKGQVLCDILCCGRTFPGNVGK